MKTCLFDLDGTLCDHTGALMRDLAKIQSPNDIPVNRHDEDEPDWAKERKKLIRSQRNWWLNLGKIQLGFEIYEITREIGFKTCVLTKGPWTCDYAWTEKVQWCRKHLHSDTKITITEDKSMVYGRVLVDDYVPYVAGWLNHRPRGLVIMVANEENDKYMEKAEQYCVKIKDSTMMYRFEKAEKEGRIVRYDGDTEEVHDKLIYAFNRE